MRGAAARRPLPTPAGPVAARARRPRGARYGATLGPSLLLTAALAAVPLAAQSREAGGREAGGEDARSGETLVRRALGGLGGPGALAAAGGLALAGTGTHDLGVLLQGTRPGVSEPVPLAERLAVTDDGERVAYESRARINPDADEWLRFVFEPPSDMLILELLARRAFREGGAEALDQHRRYARIVPHLLLAEALAGNDTLLALGPLPFAGGESAGVLWVLRSPFAGREALTLAFDHGSGRLLGWEYPADLPLRGETAVRTVLDPYREVAGLGPYPGGYRTLIGGTLLRRVRWDEIAPGGSPGAGGASLFTPPGDIELPPRTTDPAPSGAGPDAAPAEPPPAQPIVPGVWLATNVRPGFHHLIIELADGVLVTDAPAGWYELQQVPARDFVRGATSTSIGERLLEIARRTVPGKPVRWIALSHHHGDHAGGVQPFLEAGATLLASEATAAFVGSRVTVPGPGEAGRAPGPPPLASGPPAPPRVEVVTGERVVSDGARDVVLIDVGENPHARGMLAVWLPADRILWVADLFEPLPERFFPSPARLPVMRWFVDWLDRSGLEPERIYASHGSARVTPEQLEAIRNRPAGGPAQASAEVAPLPGSARAASAASPSAPR